MAESDDTSATSDSEVDSEGRMSYMVDVYRPFLTETLKCSELLPYLTTIIPKGRFRDI